MEHSIKRHTMKVTDMTEGNSARLILMFALPLLIGNVFQQIYSMVDTMVAGYNLGDHAIAAIGATSALYTLLIDLAVGLNNGYAIVVTQCFGSHDERRLKESIAGMIELDAAAAVILTALPLLFLKPLLHFMNTPDVIFAEAYHYILVICAGMTATICYNLFASILRAVGNSRTSLYFLALACILNVGLDLFFIVVLKMGVAGTAFATVIAQAVSAVLCGRYVFRNYHSILPEKEDFHVSRGMLGELAAQGLAMGMMLCVVDLGSVIFQRANNRLGEVIISAHTAARRMILIMMQPLATIAAASSTFIGQNWGAKKTERIRLALKQVLGMEVLWAAFSCALILTFSEFLVRFTTGTTDRRIIDNAILSLRWHLLFSPVLGCLLALRTAMQAMGRKAAPIISSCLELGMKILSAAYFIPKLGFLGTSITEPVTWTVMLLFLAVSYAVQERRRRAEGIEMRRKI